MTGTPTSGNPISYYNGTRWTLDWAEGRNLVSAEGTVSTGSAQEQDISVSYSYDADGLRTGKTVTVETYELVETVEEEPQSQQMEPVEELQSMAQEAEPEEIQESQEALLEESEETTPEETAAAEGITEAEPTESEAMEEPSDTETIQKSEPESVQESESVEESTLEETSVAEMSLEDLVEEENQIEETTEEEPVAEVYSGEDAELISEEDIENIEPLAATRTLVSTRTEPHDYIYAGGKLLRDTIITTTGSNTTTEILDFRYDENGYPYSLIHTVGSTTTTYYYITNLQGDVMYLVNDNGTLVASYTYAPYGNILTATGSMAEKNPLRYRGYYYDEETGFYYVSSRYYDAKIERFINADAIELIGANGDFTSVNLFAYCGNNPVIREDKGGHFWNLAAGALLGGIINGFSQVVTNMVTGNEWNSGLLGAIVTGAASGALAASGAIVNYQVIGNAVISGVSEVINQYNNYQTNSQDFSLGNAVASIVISATLGAASGYLGGDGVRAAGSDYTYALDKLDDISTKITKGVYSNPATSAKLIRRANAMVYATGKAATVETSLKFYAGAKLSQYGTVGFGMLLK